MKTRCVESLMNPSWIVSLNRNVKLYALVCRILMREILSLFRISLLASHTIAPRKSDTSPQFQIYWLVTFWESKRNLNAQYYYYYYIYICTWKCNLTIHKSCFNCQSPYDKEKKQCPVHFVILIKKIFFFLKILIRFKFISCKKFLERIFLLLLT